MGAGGEKKPGRELFSATNEIKLGKHKTFIKSLLDRGYKVESEETSEEKAFDGSIVSVTLTTTITPSSLELPMLKFVAKETFGRDNYETEIFEPWENPNLEIHTFQKPASYTQRDIPWQPTDL